MRTAAVYYDDRCTKTQHSSDAGPTVGPSLRLWPQDSADPRHSVARLRVARFTGHAVVLLSVGEPPPCAAHAAVRAVQVSPMTLFEQTHCLGLTQPKTNMKPPEITGFIGFLVSSKFDVSVALCSNIGHCDCVLGSLITWPQG